MTSLRFPNTIYRLYTTTAIINIYYFERLAVLQWTFLLQMLILQILENAIYILTCTKCERFYISHTKNKYLPKAEVLIAL